MPEEQNLIANALVSFSCAMQVQSFRKVASYAFASTMCIGNLRSGMAALFWKNIRDLRRIRLMATSSIAVRKATPESENVW